MTGNQTLDIENKPKRGGRREGAGRHSILMRGIQHAMGRRIDPLYAAQILGFVVDERRAWQRVFSSEDDRVILDALKFLVSMRDGRPAQQINVTSRNLTMTVTDLEAARAIVAEIRGEAASPMIGLEAQQGSSATTISGSLMLSGGDGGKKGGDEL